MLRSRHWLPPLVLILSLGGIYLGTLGRGLTWANNGADSGDLVTAVATGGIPHPSGYPIYLLLARLFQFLPFGSIAFRTNLFSAVCTILAAVVVYYLVTGILCASRHAKELAGLVSAYAFGLAPMVWGQAVISEVYGLHALFLALTLYLLPLGVDMPPARRERFDWLRGLVFGLGLGNHVTLIFLLPPILLTDIIRKVENGIGDRNKTWCGWSINWRPFITRLAWMVIGLLVYLTLPLRALSNPPINWGNPITPENFVWLVTGRMYASYAFSTSIAQVMARIPIWAGLYTAQFGIFGILVGVFGLFFFRNLPARVYLVTGWMVVVYSIFSLGYNSFDPEIYLIAAFLAVALWIGFGLAGLIGFLSRGLLRLKTAAGIVAIAYFLGFAALNFPKVDASHDHEAESYGQTVLETTPVHALLFTNEDETTFTLWYFQFVLHERPDLVVLDTRMLSYNWYRNMLRASYPTLEVPEHEGVTTAYEFVAANVARPVCESSRSGSPVVNCH